MYALALVNTPENVNALRALGLGGNVTPTRTKFIIVQLNLNCFISSVWHDKGVPLINIEHVAPILLLDSTLARIEYLYAEGCIGELRYKLLLNHVVG